MFVGSIIISGLTNRVTAFTVMTDGIHINVAWKYIHCERMKNDYDIFDTDYIGDYD